MLNLDVYIDNTLLDYSQTGNLNLVYSVEATEDPSKTRGSFAERSLALPVTKLNRSILENNKNRLRAEIKANGVTVFQGFAQVREVELTNNNYQFIPKSYKVNFFGGNVDWFSQIKDLLIKQLDFSDSTHVLDEATVLNALYNQNFDNSTFTYNLIKYHDWLNNSSVDIIEFTACLFIFQVLEKIINQAGYNFNSNFANTELGKSLIMPCPFPLKLGDQYAEDYLNATAEKTVTQSKAPLAFGLELRFENLIKTPPLQTAPIYIVNDPTLFSGASAYIVPVDGFYKMRTRINIANVNKPVPGNTTPFNLLLATDLQGIVQNVSFLVETTDVNRAVTAEIVVQAVAGEKLYNFILSGGGSGGVSFDVIGGLFEIVGEAEIKQGLNVDFQYLVKNWKCGDFIKNLPFNLRFEVSELTRTVTCEPAFNYLLDSIEQGFYTSTVNQLPCDLSKEAKQVFLVDQNKLNSFSYIKDSTTGSLETLGGSTAPINGCIYDLGDQFKDETSENENAFFILPPHLLDITIRSSESNKTPLVPLLWSLDYTENTIVLPSDKVIPEFATILIKPDPLTRTDGIDGLINISTSGGVQQFNNPISFAINYNDLTGQDFSLKFGNETVNNNTIVGLFERFYLSQFVNVKNALQVELRVLFDFLDVLNFSFRNMFLLDNKEFIVQELNYDPSTRESSKTIVLQNVAATDDDLNGLDSSTTSTLIQ